MYIHRYIVLATLCINPLVWATDDLTMLEKDVLRTEQKADHSLVTTETMTQLFLSRCQEKNPTHNALCTQLAAAYQLAQKTVPAVKTQDPVIEKLNALFDTFLSNLSDNEQLITSLTQALTLITQAQEDAVQTKKGSKLDYFEGPTVAQILEFMKEHSTEDNLHFLEKQIADSIAEHQKQENERARIQRFDQQSHIQ